MLSECRPVNDEYAIHPHVLNTQSEHAHFSLFPGLMATQSLRSPEYEVVASQVAQFNVPDHVKPILYN